MIDTHTHLNFIAFENDWREVVEKANKEGVKKMIVVGTNLESSRKAVDMAEEMNCLFASVGIHPHHAKKFLNNTQFSSDSITKELIEIEKLLIHPKVVAVGEVGLDRHVYRNSKVYEDVSVSENLINAQKDLFTKQVKLAVKYGKPVIIHSREAREGVLEILKQIQDKEEVVGVFHCFEGSKKYAKKILEAGFYISFTGNITYESGRAITSKEIPLNRLLLETDSPLMTPIPIRNKKEKMPLTSTGLVRGEKNVWRNEPSNVKITAKYHADLREISFEDVVGQTTVNAKTLFGI